jgi:transcriptional regulator with XRE-family HTH domain
MTKKAALSKEAERLYVSQRLSLRQVAERLGVSRSALSAWKKEGDWDEKRRQGGEEPFHLLLARFARTLMEAMQEEMAREGRCDTKQLGELEKILSHIPRIREYEEQLAGGAAERTTLDEAAVREICEKLLGVSYE